MRRSRVKTEQESKRKYTVEWTYVTQIASIGAIVGRVGSLGKTLGPSDEPTVPFLVASDELQRKSSEDSSTGWSDGLSEDTIGLSDAKFESRQGRAKAKPSAPDDPTPWSRGSVGPSDGRVEANRDDLVAGSSAPDEPMHRWCITSEQLCQRISMAKWRGRGIGWTDALKKLASVHPTLTFQWPLANDSLSALGYLYPLHSPIWGCWIVWKCRGVQDTLKIISNPSKCLIAHP
jgi:hypothetical protein